MLNLLWNHFEPLSWTIGCGCISAACFISAGKDRRRKFHPPGYPIKAGPLNPAWRVAVDRMSNRQLERYHSALLARPADARWFIAYVECEKFRRAAVVYTELQSATDMAQ